MAGCRCEPGGTLALLELIEEHRGAFEYDWRTRFQLPLSSLPVAMGWDEALRMTLILRRDTTSQVAVAVEGWQHPISRDALAILDLYDATIAVNTDSKKRPKPHGGRPFEIDSKQRNRMGKAAPAADVAAILNRHGHSLPV